MELSDVIWKYEPSRQKKHIIKIVAGHRERAYYGAGFSGYVQAVWKDDEEGLAARSACKNCPKIYLKKPIGKK